MPYGSLFGAKAARSLAFFPSAPDWLVVKAPSPLLGFNNNVRHKGRVFHIQTEDSGVRHPHVITHLFADGGRILKSTKTSYTEHLGQTSMAETVRAMMQEQHKAMFIALRDGQFDHLFEDAGGSRTSANPQPPKIPPAPLSVPGATPSSVAAAVEASPRVAVPPPPVAAAPPPPVAAAPPPPVAAAPPPPIAVAPPPPVAVPPPPPVVAAPPLAVIMPPPPVAEEAPSGPPPLPHRYASRPQLALDAAVLLAREPASTPSPQSSSEPTIDLDLDLDALERAAAEAQTPFFQQIQDLPPPPAAVLGKRPAASGYSVTASYEGTFATPPPPMPGPQVGRIAPPAPGRVPPPPVSTAPPKLDPTSSGRYAPSRPAAIFATTRPPEGASIFGEDLISEKSLDEVILSYLAEDLEGPTDKK
jgi:hypothetical protein